MTTTYILDDVTDVSIHDLYLMDAEIIKIWPRVIAKVGVIEEGSYNDLEPYW